MKIQACTFSRCLGAQKERGLAFQDDFDSNDIKFIVDENGKKVGKSLWDYRLIEPTFDNPNVGIDLTKICITSGKYGG